MSKMSAKSSGILDEALLQVDNTITKTKKYPKIEQKIVRYSPIEEENNVYVSQLQELARVFSSSGDRHIRQYIINLAKGVIERANDYAKAEAYIAEMTN